MYKLIKPFTTGGIEFSAGTVFKCPRPVLNRIYLQFSDIHLWDIGGIFVSFSDLNEYFVKVEGE